MPKLILILLAAFVIVALGDRVEAAIGTPIIAPIGLAPGSEYQLIFVTHDARNTVVGDITSYNGFVADQAALNPLLPTATWTAVVSSATVAALSNAPNVMVDGAYLPVYNTQGTLVSTAGLYSGSLLAPVLYDQFDGNPNDRGNGGSIWTGSNPDGTIALGHAVGASYSIEAGNLFSSTDEWISQMQVAQLEYLLDVYALSSPITYSPTPEPSSLVVWSLLGALGLLAARRR